jgi:chromosome partitioning protein
LSRQGKRILLIDMDSQANASKVLLPDYLTLRHDQTICRTILERQPLPIYPTAIDTLHIAPSHILLSNADVELTVAKDHREARLRQQLQPIATDYDHVIIDCPPALGWLTLNAFAASDAVLVVIAPGYFELDSVVQINKTIHEVANLYNPYLQLLGYLFTMSDPTVNSRTSLKILRQTYTEQVVKTVIPRNTDIRDAHFQKQDVFGYAPQAKSADAYLRLIEELGL